MVDKNFFDPSFNGIKQKPIQKEAEKKAISEGLNDLWSPFLDFFGNNPNSIDNTDKMDKLDAELAQMRSTVKEMKNLFGSKPGQNFNEMF